MRLSLGCNNTPVVHFFMKKKYKRSEYRMYENGVIYSIIKVHYDSKDKIIGYTDYIYPIGLSMHNLKINISDMLKATRKVPLTNEDLKHL